MAAEDVQCRLLYKHERVTIVRECGQMLTEERAVRTRVFVVWSAGIKKCRVFQSRFFRVVPCVWRVCEKAAMLTYKRTLE